MVNKSTLLKILLIAFLVKGFFFFGGLSIYHELYPKEKIKAIFYVQGKDTESHIAPCENWWDEGTYYEQVGDEQWYAFRPPGYAPFYLPFYIVLGKDGAMASLTLLWFLLDAISCVLLFLIALNITKNKQISFLVFGLFVLLPFVSVYSHTGKSEVPSTILVVWALYAMVKFENKKHFFWLVLSGLFVAWASLVRPATALFVPLMAILIFFFQNWKLNKKTITYWSTYIIPIFILLGSWTVRNYVVLRKVVPIQDMSVMDKKTKTFFDFVSTIGGDIQGWIPNSEAAWFAPVGTQNYVDGHTNTNPFDSQMFTQNFTYDSMLVLRTLFRNTIVSETNRGLYDSLFIAKAVKYKGIYLEERNPWYWIKSEVKMFLRFIFVKYPHGTILQKSTFWYQVGKLYWLGTYYMVIIGGFFGFFLGLLKRETWVIILGGFCIFYLGVHANFLGLIENRYLAAIFPLLAILGAYGTIWLVSLKAKLNK